MSDDTALIRAFLEGKRAERKAIAKWLRDKAYLTLSDLVKAGVHVHDAEKPVIRPLDDAERAAARERESCNRKR